MKNLVLIILCMCCAISSCQNPWEVSTFPGEERYQKLTGDHVERIASVEFGEKSKARSKCPDTDLTVRTWALEGETIYSPYTGRAYLQGPTGYFGPKARGADGRLIAFGGDPLKKDLPPALANLLLDPGHAKARQYLSIPGNLRQQYHFACKNWGRFYPLLGAQMGENWNREFEEWIAVYTESRRPSDGHRQHAPLSTPHNLVGEPGQLLGGNMKNGGTENHKTMWRTSALLYSQLLPKGSRISGYNQQDAGQLTTTMIREYLQKALTVGNGEYDSEIYYPHSMEGFMNLYDFSPDPDTRLMARTALDFYLATYALKVMDGILAGGQKRGSLPDAGFASMDHFCYPWNSKVSTAVQTRDKDLSIHLATTSYRPNRVITNILEKNLELPFEATMSRPVYHMNTANAFQEYFYCSRNFAIGSVYMTMVDNPNQQIVWSLVARGKEGPLRFGGLQPFHRHPSGHSPFSQTLQHKGNLVVVTGPTEVSNGTAIEELHRARHAAFPLETVPVPKGRERKDPTLIMDFFEASPKSSSTWFFIPREVDECYEENGKWYIRAHESLLCLIPLAEQTSLLSVEDEVAALLPAGRTKAGVLQTYDILIMDGRYSGYYLQCAEREEYGDLKGFQKAIEEKSHADTTNFGTTGTLRVNALDGTELDFRYQNHALRCKGSINGKLLDFESWNDGYVYRSPYLVIGNGSMWVSDGKDGYSVDYTGDNPVYTLQPDPPDLK